MNKLAEKAVLMRLSISLPGEHRQDPAVTEEVKIDKALGQASGKWVKNLYPKEALGAIRSLDNEADAFHRALTLPFDRGIGILPAVLIQRYADQMREFASRREVLIADFLGKAEQWIAWAAVEHNGTFNAEDYPGCKVGPDGKPVVDPAVFKDEMAKRFEFRTCPLPVPNAEHFTQTVTDLLGVDTKGVDLLIRDAVTEAQQKLLSRMLKPVTAMAKKLAEAPKMRKDGKMASDITFRDTLVENLREIAGLVPALNIAENPALAEFGKAVGQLARFSPDDLRDNKAIRSQAQSEAEALMQRLAGYKL